MKVNSKLKFAGLLLILVMSLSLLSASIMKPQPVITQENKTDQVRSIDHKENQLDIMEERLKQKSQSINHENIPTKKNQKRPSDHSVDKIKSEKSIQINASYNSHIDGEMTSWSDLKEQSSLTNIENIPFSLHKDTKLMTTHNGYVEFILKRDVLSADLYQKLTNLNVKILKNYNSIDATLVGVPTNALTSNSFFSKISSFDQTSYIEPNVYMKPTALNDQSLKLDQTSFTPNDPKWSNQYGPQALNMPQAWLQEMGDQSVKVAVIDTGINYSHPDLKDNYDSSLSYDWVENDTLPQDPIGHGTHVAGTIAAGIDNGIGIAGIADVTIFAERFITWGGGSSVDAALSIQHAVSQGADILSNSWGSYFASQTIKTEIDKATQQGVLFVAAAGNGGIRIGQNIDHYPSGFDNAISVGAIDNTNDQAIFSNYGDQIDIVAPGVDVLSTIGDSSYVKFSGTSMAAPHVSGALAIMMSAFPSYSIDELESLLYDTANDLGNPGWDKHYGHGIVNVQQALDGLSQTNIATKLDVQYPLTYHEENRINYTVINFGQTTATDFTITGKIDQQVIFSKTIDSLGPHESKEFSHMWTPTKLKVYDIKIEVPLLSNEVAEDYDDNAYVRQVEVEYPRYYWEDYNVDYDWKDAKANGYNLNMVGEDAVSSVNLPFDFRFYDKVFDEVYISTNGFISFATHKPLQFDYLDVYHPYTIVAVASDFNSTNSVYAWKTSDFVAIEYNNHEYPFDGTRETFQIVLYKNGSIIIQYKDLTEEFTGDIEFEVGVRHGYNPDLKTYNKTVFSDNTQVATKFYQPQAPYDLVMDMSEVDLAYPNHIPAGREILINGTITNTGEYDRTNIPFVIETNTGYKKNITIPKLEAGESFTLSKRFVSSNYGFDTVIWMNSAPRGNEQNHAWWPFKANNYVRYKFNVSRMNNFTYTKLPNANWYDAKTNGDQLDIVSGDHLVEMQFEFNFYNKKFSTVNVSRNGYLTFSDSFFLEDWETKLPESEEKYHYIIAPWWDDYWYEDPNVYYWNTSSYTVVEFYHSDTGAWQAVLHSDGDITFNYKNFTYQSGTIYGLDKKYPYEIGINHGADPNYYSRVLHNMSAISEMSIQFDRFPHQQDLAVQTYLNASEALEVGSTHNITGFVANKGTTTISNISLNVYKSGESSPSGTYFIGSLAPGEGEFINHAITPTEIKTYNYAISTNSISGETYREDNSDTISFTPSAKIGIVTDNRYGDLVEIKEYYESKNYQVDYLWDLETQQNHLSSYNLLLIGDGGATSWESEQKWIMHDYIDQGGAVLGIGNNLYLPWLSVYGFSQNELTSFMENSTANILGHEITTEVQDLKLGATNRIVANKNDSLALVNDTTDSNTIFSITTDKKVGMMTFDLDRFVEYDETRDLLDHLTLWDTNPSPSVLKPDDISYEVNTTGHSIRWSFSDDNPSQYKLYKNGSQIEKGFWSNPGEILVNIDGLSTGTYEYSIHVTDQSGFTTKDSVVVEVVLPGVPQLSHPTDLTYTEGETGNTIIWSVSDSQNDLSQYQIYRNSSLQVTNLINTSTIDYNVDGLSVGTYEFEIIVEDSEGQTQSDQVIVTVVPEKTTTSFNTPNEFLPWNVLAITLSILTIPVCRRFKRSS